MKTKQTAPKGAEAARPVPLSDPHARVLAFWNALPRRARQKVAKWALRQTFNSRKQLSQAWLPFAIWPVWGAMVGVGLGILMDNPGNLV